MNWAALAVSLVVASGGPIARRGEPPNVSVTVVVVLATGKNTDVPPRLVALAEHVTGKEPGLTGFRQVSDKGRSVPIGQAAEFELVDKLKLKVTIDAPRGTDGKVGLTLSPPGMDVVKYACACGKYVPVITGHTTKGGERLVLAVMAKPCQASMR